MKTCSKCKALKSLESFSKNSHAKSGKRPNCKKCDAAYEKEHRKNNPDITRASVIRYKRANPEMISKHKTLRRARKRGAEGTYTVQEWQDLKKQCGYACVCCGTTNVPLVPDHIVPLARKGSNYISNIQPLCSPCNSKKHTKTINYLEKIWIA